MPVRRPTPARIARGSRGINSFRCAAVLLAPPDWLPFFWSRGIETFHHFCIFFFRDVRARLGDQLFFAPLAVQYCAAAVTADGGAGGVLTFRVNLNVFNVDGAWNPALGESTTAAIVVCPSFRASFALFCAPAESCVPRGTRTSRS